jgi:hypothetical protein
MTVTTSSRRTRLQLHLLRSLLLGSYAIRPASGPTIANWKRTAVTVVNVAKFDSMIVDDDVLPHGNVHDPSARASVGGANCEPPPSLTTSQRTHKGKLSAVTVVNVGKVRVHD